MFEIYYCNMVRQNLGLPYLPQKWYGNCRACRAGGAAHAATAEFLVLYISAANHSISE